MVSPRDAEQPIGESDAPSPGSHDRETDPHDMLDVGHGDGARAGDSPPPRRRFPVTTKQVVKVVAGAAIVAAFGWIPLQSLLQQSSVEAVINSRIVTLRAPIDGRVTKQEALSSQKNVAQGEIVLHVANSRARERVERRAVS